MFVPILSLRVNPGPSELKILEETINDAYAKYLTFSGVAIGSSFNLSRAHIV